MVTRSPFLTRNCPHALQGLLCSKSSIDLATSYPSRQDATTLWNNFDQRVYPVSKIMFGWALKRLHLVSIEPEYQKQLTDAEHAFIFALYLMSVISLSDDDCRKAMHQPRTLLIFKFQTLCEEALSRTNIFCITDTMVFRALTLYMVDHTSSKIRSDVG